ncbi:MAG: hypothetical protein V8S95_03755 [Odoribacter sp.]
MDLGRPCTFQPVELIEQANYIENYTLEITDGPDDNWKIVHWDRPVKYAELSSFMGYGYGEIHLSKPLTPKNQIHQTATNTPCYIFGEIKIKIYLQVPFTNW